MIEHTIPAISLFICGLVIGYLVFFHGLLTKANKRLEEEADLLKKTLKDVAEVHNNLMTQIQDIQGKLVAYEMILKGNKR